MMKSSNSVAAIVVTYNRKKLLETCMKSLLRQTQPLDSIMIIDNASSDGTYESLLAGHYLENPVIDYVRMPENTGGAGGFHEGMKRGCARGFDYLWLMDDDAEPYEDCLQELMTAFSALQHEKSIAALFPLKITEEMYYYGGKYRYVDYDNPLQQFIWHFSPEFVKSDLAEKYIKLGTLSFEGPLIPSEIIRRAGYPDPRFFIFFDDYEYSHRLKHYGEIILCTAARMKIKDVSRTSSKAIDWRRYYSVRNRVYIQRQIGSGWTKFIDPLLFTMESLAGAVRHRRGLKNLKLVLQAARDGWLGRLGKTIDPAHAG